MADNASAAAAGSLSNADHLQPLPNTTATQAVDSEEHAVDPTALGLNATAWVALAMIVVIILLLWKKVPAIIGASLDKKIAAIRAQLDEASSLRAEAEAIKAEAEAQAREAAADAEQLLVHARDEAQLIVAEMRAEGAAMIDRHVKMAEEKIAAAERAAIADVRAKAASAATAAATQIIAERHDATTDKALVDRTITGLGATRLN